MTCSSCEWVGRRVCELIFLALWIIPVWMAWIGWDGTAAEENGAERQLGASVIHAQLNGVITGASIIIAGIGAFAALHSGRGFPRAAKSQLRTASVRLQPGCAHPRAAARGGRCSLREP